MKKNKRYLLIGFFSVFFLSFACKNLITCEKIKNGKFYYYTKRTREKIDIERIDSLQIEMNAETGGSIVKSKVVWKDDCKYDMFINAFSETKLTGDDSIIAATPAHIEIINIGKSFYVCIAKLRVFNKDVVLKDTIYFKE